jgi:peptidoglycan hydrolase-like protein with peptidoglycan-binding domain
MFSRGTKLNIPLQAHDWASFASGYNGKNYAINRYDVRLNSEFQKYFVAGLPDCDVRAAQLYLTYLDFHPGPVDGIAGEQTLSALAQFQTQQGIQNSGTIDSDTVAQLSTALP